jgi:hypothetical protein
MIRENGVKVEISSNLRRERDEKSPRSMQNTEGAYLSSGRKNKKPVVNH